MGTDIHVVVPLAFEQARQITTLAKNLQEEVEQRMAQLEVRMQDWSGEARDVARRELDRIRATIIDLGRTCAATGTGVERATENTVAVDQRVRRAFEGGA